MLDDIERELISANAIATRVTELGEAISTDYTGHSLTLVIVSNGAILFGADLVRTIQVPLELDTISAASYTGTVSGAELEIRSRFKLCVRDRDVVIVDDILDSGQTLTKLKAAVAEMGARSVKSCVLLSKRCERACEIEAEYVGFEIDDEWVVGYGLDYDEQYRQLPFIGVLSPALHRVG